MPVAHVSDLVQHEGHALELTPGGRGGCASGEGGDACFLAAGGPDLFGFGHAVAEVGVDFGNFGLGDHGGCLLCGSKVVSYGSAAGL